MRVGSFYRMSLPHMGMLGNRIIKADFDPELQYPYSFGSAIACMKCGKCDMEFSDKERLERHKKVHGRKPKISEAGGIDFSQVGA
jgi:hypothetical protein